MKRLSVLLIMLATLVGCSRSSEDSEAVPVRLPDFSTFADDYFETYFTFHPSEATDAGIHRFDNQLEQWTASRFQQRINELTRQQRLLAALRKTRLSENDAIDAELIDNRISAELLDLDRLRMWRRNPLMYAVIPGHAVDSLMKRNFASPRERLRLIVARMKLVPALIDAMRNNIAEVPREFAELALRTSRGSITFFRDELPAWAKQSAGNDLPLWAEFSNANRRVVNTLEVTAQFMATDLMLTATGNYAIGSDNFTSKLKYEEMVDIPLARLVEIGQANLDRDYNAFVETARRIGGGSPADVMRSLASQHPEEDGLIPFARATSERIRQFVVSRNIIPIPSDVRPSVLPTPTFMRAMGFAFMDTPGAFETNAREAFYYVTPTEPDWTPQHKEEHLRLFNRPVMDIITIHEAWPGHYVQFLYANQFPTKTRKIISCGTNAEGWAHYAEQMMVEQGFGEGDPKINLAQLAEALVRDARYLAGIRLHTEGWTVDQAKKLFMEKAFLDEANALEEARRGTYNPTYLYYTLGKMQIYKLRQDMQAKKGSAFSLAEFHRDFVKQGAVPIPVVRRIMLGANSGPAL